MNVVRTFLGNSVLTLLLWVASFSISHCAQSLSISADPKRGVDVKVEQLFDEVPEIGYMPVRVTIKNNTGSERTWTFSSSSNPSSYVKGNFHYFTTQRLKVASGEEKVFEILAPLGARDSTGGASLAFTVTGYGMVSERDVARHSVHRRDSSKYLLLSSDLYIPFHGALKKHANDRGGELLSSSFSKDTLPKDWKGLIGVNVVWISEKEWEDLTDAHRGGLKDWVAFGGKLYILTERVELLQAMGDRHGYGLKDYRVWDGSEFPHPTVYSSVRVGSKRTAELLKSDYNYNFGEESSEIWSGINKIFSIVFMILFALIIGPVNLFIFAGGRKRARLFFTTPAISLVASLLLIVVILMQDGIGGSGKRWQVIHLLPTNQLVVMQEQHSRTGLLLWDSFERQDDFFMNGVPIRTINAGTLSLSLDADSFRGDWFENRALRVHFLADIKPTRSSLQLVEKDEAGRPVVLSTISTPLDTLYYVDEDGNHWKGTDIRVGQKVTLQPSGRTSFERWYEPMRKKGGLWLRMIADEALQKNGYFYATAVSSLKEAEMNTLPSISWQEEQALIFGSLKK